MFFKKYLIKIKRDHFYSNYKIVLSNTYVNIGLIKMFNMYIYFYMKSINFHNFSYRLYT